MPWSYSKDPTASDLDAVRFLIQDTDTNRQLTTDEEILWAISQEDNIYMAAAAVADAIGSRSANVKRKKVGNLEIEYDAEHWKKMAARLRNRGCAYKKPSAGGISIADKDVLENNTDWPTPDFQKGMFDNPSDDDPLKRCP